LAQTLAGRSFEVAVDMTLYTGKDAETIVSLLAGRVGQYIFISTGQVYLVRTGVQRPFREEDYPGPVMAAPPTEGHDYSNWLYGVEKREVEDSLRLAWERQEFPFVSLRLPMVNSERDHFYRIYSYLRRLRDGGPILIPAEPGLPLRHVYGEDVVKAILIVIEKEVSQGRAFNISQDETLSLEQFLSLLAEMAGHALKLAPLPRQVLEEHQLLPACSPFSGSWMSELDNQRSKMELSLYYTPLLTYLQRLVGYYQAHPPPPPPGYERRQEEIKLAG
jgi:nucleoside-diphosphate-sugar epimerase